MFLPRHRLLCRGNSFTFLPSSLKLCTRPGSVRWRPITVHQRKSLASDATPVTPGCEKAELKPDVLIIGCGAAGMLAALRAKAQGLSPLLVEKTSLIGGATTFSAGVMWIPNSHIPTPGYEDSLAEALTYMEALIGDAGPASSRERKLAFLENGPKMARFLEDQGFNFIPSWRYPDYYPNVPGGKKIGRAVEGAVFDVNKLGPWKKQLNYNPMLPPLPIHAYEGPLIYHAMNTFQGFAKAATVLGRMISSLWGRAPRAAGVSLTGQLLHLNLQKGIPIWMESALKELVLKDGKVVGAIIEKEGTLIKVDVQKGVLLASGGFSQNSEMRKTYQSYNPTNSQFSLAPSADQGDGINAANNINAAMALMDEAWWFPVTYEPVTKKLWWLQFERPLPHSIIVDKEGNRFANESESYSDFVQNQFKRDKTVSAIPAYLIMDWQFRKRYILNFIMPGKIPQKHLDSGFITQGTTLADLAQQLGINENGLEKTVTRWNKMVTKGVDEDYNRGGSAYDNFHADPIYIRKTRNGNMGSIEQGPFYAVKVWPGDLGTRGGILTDEYARALKEDGKGGFDVIEGLYATGNCSASVMGRRYAGAGATIAPAMTFGFIAIDHIAGR